MKLDDAILAYLASLEEASYSAAERTRKGTLLHRHLALAVGRHHPQLPRTLLALREIRLCGRGAIKTETTPERRQAVEHFLEVYRLRHLGGSSYLALEEYLEEYRRERLQEVAARAVARRAIEDFLRALALDSELYPLSLQSCERILATLSGEAVERAASYAVSFFLYCHGQGWLSFAPPSRLRSPYERTFEPDFLGPCETAWTRKLRLYLEHLQADRNLSAGGIDYYMRKLKILVRWFDSHRQGERVSERSLKLFLAEKKAEGLASGTLSKYLYSARYFFDFLIERGLLTANPAKELRLLCEPAQEGEQLTEEEVSSVIATLEAEEYRCRGAEDLAGHRRHFRTLRDLCLFLLFCLTGCRLSEACGMRMSDIDFDKRVVRIVAKGNRACRHKHREIPLPDLLWSYLGRYLRVRPSGGEEALWLSSRQWPLNGAGINQLIASRLRQAGIEKRISPHRLRASCASLYVKKGMDPLSLKNLLGHQSIATTIDRYARLTEEELREVWKKTNPLAGDPDE